MCGMLWEDGWESTGHVLGQEQKRKYPMQKWREARFAGTKNPTLFVGDVIEVTKGEDVGQVLEVLDIRGHAYSADNRIVVENHSGEVVYYHPWDVELVHRRHRVK